MRTTFLTTTTTLLSLSALTLAQDALPTAAPTATADSGLALPSTANVNAIVSYLLPTLSSTSLSPSQSSAILSDAASYVSSYTAANPLQDLTTGLIGAALGAVLGDQSTPDAAQRSQIVTLLQAAPSALVNDPGAFVSSVEGLVSPFSFIATRVSSYEQGFQGGLATVVADELNVEPPPPEPTGDDAGDEGAGVALRARPVVVGVVVGAVAGVLGLLV